MKEKLTIQDLAMFIGCDVRLDHYPYPVGVLDAVDIVGCKVTTKARQVYHYSRITPILRPLSDMTEEEVMEFFEITNYFIKGTSEEYKRNRTYLIKRDQQFSYRPENIKWLLSKHFDVFGWIESGLAIDKSNLIN